MKVNIAGSPVTLFGEPFKDEAGKPVEYRTLLENAVLASYQDEQGVSGEEKLKRWKLAQRVHDSDGLLSVNAKEIELLKTLAAKAYTTPLSAQVWLLLEGESDAPSLKAVGEQ